MLLCFPLYYLKKSIISIHGPRTAEAYSKQQEKPQRSKIIKVNSVGITVVSLDMDNETCSCPRQSHSNKRFFYSLLSYKFLPCEQWFISCMAFSTYEVVRVACQSRKRTSQLARRVINSSCPTHCHRFTHAYLLMLYILVILFDFVILRKSPTVGAVQVQCYDR